MQNTIKISQFQLQLKSSYVSILGVNVGRGVCLLFLMVLKVEGESRDAIAVALQIICSCDGANGACGLCKRANIHFKSFLSA